MCISVCGFKVSPPFGNGDKIIHLSSLMGWFIVKSI